MASGDIQAWMNEEDGIPGIGRSPGGSAHGNDAGMHNGTIGDTAPGAYGAPDATADGAEGGIIGMPIPDGATGHDGECQRQSWMNAGNDDIWGTPSGGTSSVLGDS